MRKRTLLSNGGGNMGEVNVSDALACDVVFYNHEEDRLIIRREQKYWKKNETPIGIVVIPASHNVYGDGSCGVMSLKHMSMETPEAGTIDNETIEWCVIDAKYNKEISTIGVDVTPSNKVTQQVPSYRHGMFPIQTIVNGPANYDEIDHPNIEYYIPSPYKNNDLNSGDFNDSFKGFIPEIDGLTITEDIISYEQFQPTWRTDEKINSRTYYTQEHYMASLCSGRYKTEGTKAIAECTDGELKEGKKIWYLPTISELIYIFTRYVDIGNILSSLNRMYDKVAVSLGYNYYSCQISYTYTDWEYYEDYNVIFFTEKGCINSAEYYNRFPCLAFMRL